MEEWVDDAADQLEKLTRDPMADAAHGAVRIARISRPEGRRRFVECDISLQVEAVGMPERTVQMQVVLDRRHWPASGTVLPARISRTHPDVVEVDWDALAR